MYVCLNTYDILMQFILICLGQGKYCLSAAYTVKMSSVVAAIWLPTGCLCTCKIQYKVGWCMISGLSCRAGVDHVGQVWPKYSVYHQHCSIHLIYCWFAWFRFCSVYHHFGTVRLIYFSIRLNSATRGTWKSPNYWNIPISSNVQNV